MLPRSRSGIFLHSLRLLQYILNCSPDLLPVPWPRPPSEIARALERRLRPRQRPMRKNLLKRGIQPTISAR